MPYLKWVLSRLFYLTTIEGIEDLIVMRFNSVKSENFTSGAKAVNRNMDAFLDASIKSRPDFTKISTASMKGRSAERQAAEKSKGIVDLANINADADIKVDKIRSKSDKSVAGIKRPAQRMAGVVGGLGALSSYAIMAKNNREDNEAAEKMEALYAARTKEVTAAIEASKPEPYVPGTYEGTPYTPLPTGGSPSTPSTSSSPTSSVPTSSSQGRVSQTQMRQLLIDQGMDPENATIGAAVGMGESSGRPGVLNSNNEYSLGLWQHNRDTGEDRRDLYGIKDWSELKDPATNARATYRLWKRRGGWQDWGAYTNGSYKDFL